MISKNKNPQPGVTVTLDELIACRFGVQPLRVQQKRAAPISRTGAYQAKSRGRGLEFAEVREYQAGDDLRHMDWRVTARSGKPHTKVYHEERERPVLIAVDFSPSMYFGTREYFKSAAAARACAHLGWRAIKSGDRVGALLATCDEMIAHKTGARESAFLPLLKRLTEQTAMQPDFSQESPFKQSLHMMRQMVRPGSLVYLISDFYQLDNESTMLLRHLASLCQLNLVLVYDPLEAVAPPANHYWVSDGKRTLHFNTQNEAQRQAFGHQFQQRYKNLARLSRGTNASLYALRTDQSLPQVFDDVD
jgi:uncharacterized protein (DUF58 family)